MYTFVNFFIFGVLNKRYINCIMSFFSLYTMIDYITEKSIKKMTTAPKVSIIIPVYNDEIYIRQCLDSLINQSLKELEIIIVDDGSTNSAGAICDEYAEKDDRIKVIHKENEGSGIARNFAIKLAQGEFIGFVDSDDWVDSDYFEKMYNSAITNNADISIGEIKRYSDGKMDKCSYTIDKTIMKENSQQAINFQFYPGVWDKIYRKDVVINNNIEFAEKLLYQDVPFNFKALFYANRIVTCPNVFYYYRLNLNSVSYKSGDVLFNIFKIFDICQDFINKIDSPLLNSNFQEVLNALKIRHYYYYFPRADMSYRKTFLDKIKEDIKNIDLNKNNYLKKREKIKGYLLKYSLTPFCVTFFLYIFATANKIIKINK